MVGLLLVLFREELSIEKLANYLGKHNCSLFNFTLQSLECPVELPRNINCFVCTKYTFPRCF